MELSDTPLRRFCTESADLSNIKTPKEVNQFHEDVEKLLTTLDEYCNLVDLVRGDTSHILSVALPQLHDKAELLKQVFDKIDCLELFMQDMRQNVDAMELAVDAAERDLGTLTTLKKSFLSKFSSKPMLSSKPTDPVPTDGPVTFQPPNISDLSEWMPSVADSVTSAAAVVASDVSQQ